MQMETNRPWRKSKTTAVLLAVFLGAWTWIYTYRQNAWKATLGLSIQLGAITSMLFIWFWLGQGYDFLFFGFVIGETPTQLFHTVHTHHIVPAIVLIFLMWLGIQIWAIIDATRAKVWELDSSKRRNKTAAILFAVFVGPWNWLYTYKKDAWKFWVGVAVVIIYPPVSYLTWFNPFDMAFWMTDLGITPSEIWLFWIQYLSIIVPTVIIWLVGVILASVRKQEWYQSFGQATNTLN